MSHTDIYFTMGVRVYDRELLYEAACDMWETTCCGEGRDDTLRPEGEIDIAACVQMLADPGVSWAGTTILESGCEVF